MKRLIVIFFIWLSFVIEAQALTVSQKDAQEIGRKIWHNECNGTIEGLTSWNIGENFASVGIGHFIWYPPHVKKNVFKETFPALLTFLEKNGKKIPAGVLKKNAKACPWNSREEFLANIDSPAMKALRAYLSNTIDLQTTFMVRRLQKALGWMVKNLPVSQQLHIKKQFYRLAKSPGGLYALVDYVNFKGEGLELLDRYQGYRWGLLQVLEKMQGSTMGRPALEEFAQSAKDVLWGRVEHAPQESQAQEKKWFIGWSNRINTYLN